MNKTNLSDFGMNLLPTYLKKLVIKYLSENIETPYIIYSKEQIHYNLEFFLKIFNISRQQVIFPVKVCHDQNILKFLSDCHINFEIASAGELELLKNLKIEPEKIIFSNPVKIPKHIEQAYEYGINTFAADGESELEKMKLHAPSAGIYIRLSVSNKGADWKLKNKFGASKKECIQLIKKISTTSLNVNGLSFHVGWNNTNPEAFAKALDDVNDVLEQLKFFKISLKFLNIGGGFPAHLVDQYQFLKKISKKINDKLKKLQDNFDLKICAEPGSFILANTAALISSVIDIVKRKNSNWIFLDAGIFQGFQWIMSGIRYQIIYPYPNYKHKTDTYTVTGPTCDSQDIFIKKIRLPADLKPGDKLCIFPTGAYTNSSKEYNGIKYPNILLM